MPIISQYQHQTLPAWYAGQQQALGEAAEASRKAEYKPYEASPGVKIKRLADFLGNPDIKRAYELARQEGVDRPYLEEANMMSREGANAQFDPNTMIEPYMDPYRRQVVEQMRDLANEGFLKDLLPALQRQYISSGAYNSTAQKEASKELAATHQRSLQDAMTRALSEGYRPAAEQAGKMFEAGNARKLEGAGIQKELGPLAQAGKLADIEALRQVGGEKRDREQAELDLAYQDFLRQENFPYRQQQHQAGILTGMPQQMQDVYSAQQTPGQPQLNTVGQLGALAGNIYGARQAGGFGRKAGGPVKKAKGGLSAMPLMQSSMSKKPKTGGSLGIKHAKNKDKLLYGKSNNGRSIS